MEEVLEYKNEIAATRKGSLGSSDGRMLAQIASLGCVPKSAYKRLAVVKGLIPHDEIPKNAAIIAGDTIENIVFDNLKSQDPRYESNPLWVSEKYSRKNCKLISHPDYVLQDEARKIINIYECKTTKHSVAETRQTYKAQLYLHYQHGLERAKKLGDDWKVRLFLVHYSTEGLDLTEGIEYDPSRLTVKEVRFSEKYFDVAKAMDIVDDFLETFDSYYEGDEVNADLLPEKVKSQFENVAAMLVEIKERENKVKAFKEYLYKFMLEKDIKSIKNPYFSITRVDATVSKSFDAKKFIEDIKKVHPRKANKIVAQYTKTQNRSGFVNIKVKEDKD